MLPNGRVTVALVLVFLHSVVSVTSFTCPGASVENSAAGSEDCSAPTCTVEIWTQNKLLPHRNPRKFYQCGPGLNYYEMNCALGTCFSPKKQVCVHPYEWKNPCKGEELVTPAPSTTTTTIITTPAPEETTTEETTVTVTEITTIEEPLTTPEITTDTTESATTEVTEAWTTEATEAPTTEAPTTVEETTPEVTTEASTTVVTDTPTTQEPDTTTLEPPTETTDRPQPPTTVPTTPSDTTFIDSVETTTSEERFETDPTTTETSSESNSSEATTEAPPATTTKAPYSGQICPGVDRNTVEEGEYDCKELECHKDSVKQKLPYVDPQYYQECLGNSGTLRKVKCATGCFSVTANKCVEASLWVNACRE